MRCVHKGNGFFFPTLNKTWKNLQDDIRDRFKFNKDEKIRIQYHLPGAENCFIQDDCGYKVMVFGGQVYLLDLLEVVIDTVEISTLSSSTISHIDKFFDQEDRDGHLVLAFKDEDIKPFLSKEWKTYIARVGQRFKLGIDDFRDKLKKYAIVKGFTYRCIRNDADRIYVVCNYVGEDAICGWYIKGTVSYANSSFFIDELDHGHTCKRVVCSHYHEYLNSSIVASCILDEVMYNQAIKPKVIISRFKASYRFSISYKVALRAINKAKKILYGNDRISFDPLSWFQEAVLTTNPDFVLFVFLNTYFYVVHDPLVITNH